MDVMEKVRSFILEELRWPGQPQLLTPEYPLIANRVVDSMGIFRIVTMLEQEFAIEVDDEDLVPANFGTLAAIEGLVASKRASLGADRG